MNDNSSKDNSSIFERFVNSNMEKLERIARRSYPALKNQIKMHGFAINRRVRGPIFNFYNHQMNLEKMFISSDYIFYFFTQLLDTCLIVIEQDFLIPQFWILTEQLLTSQLDLFNRTKSELHQGLIQQNIALLSVVNALLNPAFHIPSMVKTMVTSELANISQRNLLYSEIFQYKEDFSQYKIRGHYTQTLDLQHYFQAMQYLHRMFFMIQGDNVEEQKRKNLTHQAFLLLISFEQEEIYSAWNEIDTFLEFWIGHSDDLTINEYFEVWDKCGKPDPLILSTEGLWGLVKHELEELRNPLVKSRVYTPQTLDSQNFKGLRIFGQSSLIDSVIFQKMTDPFIKDRFFPTALDWMALFGSRKAWACLHSEGLINNTYKKQFANIQPEVSSYFENPFEELLEFGSNKLYERLHTRHYSKHLNRLRWHHSHDERELFEKESTQIKKTLQNDKNSNLSIQCKSVYGYFLYCLKGFWEKIPNNLPEFMKSPLWDLKTLQTVAGAWVQARHSLVLYAKSSAVCAGISTSYGYIEPQVEVYSRFLDFVSFLLERFRIFQHIKSSSVILENLEKTSSLLQKTLLISRKELENRFILPAEGGFIRGFGITTNNILKSLQQSVNPQHITPDNEGKIVDVHTEHLSRLCLEVGIGQAQEIIVIVPNHLGQLRFTRGAVFPYYEFTQPIDQRLSDSEWQAKEDNFSVSPPIWLHPLYSDDREEIAKDVTEKYNRLDQYVDMFVHKKAEYDDEMLDLTEKIKQAQKKADYPLISQLIHQHQRLIREHRRKKP
jgi:hypothetical protein